MRACVLAIVLGCGGQTHSASTCVIAGEVVHLGGSWSDDTAVGRSQLDESDVVWAGDGGIVRTPKLGGPATIVVPRDRRYRVGPFRLDADRLYYLVRETNESKPALAAIPKRGGAATMLAASLGWDGAYEIGIDGDSLYGASAESIESISKSGGAPKRIAACAAYCRIVGVDGSDVYFTSFDRGAVALLRAPKNGGAARKLANLSGVFVGPAALGETRVFWTSYYAFDQASDRATYRVSSVKKDGSDEQVVGSSQEERFGDVVVGDDAVYASVGYSTSGVRRFPFAGGGSMLVMVSSIRGVGGLATDASGVYGAAFGEHGAELFRIPCQ